MDPLILSIICESTVLIVINYRQLTVLSLLNRTKPGFNNSFGVLLLKFTLFPLAQFLIFLCILCSPVNWWLFPSCNNSAVNQKQEKQAFIFLTDFLESPAMVCSTILRNIFCSYLSKKGQKYSHCVTFTFTLHLSKLVHLNKIIVME